MLRGVPPEKRDHLLHAAESEVAGVKELGGVRRTLPAGVTRSFAEEVKFKLGREARVFRPSSTSEIRALSTFFVLFGLFVWRTGLIEGGPRAVGVG